MVKKSTKKTAKKPAAKKATKKPAKKAAKKKAAKATNIEAEIERLSKKPSPLKGKKKAAEPVWQEHPAPSGFKILHRAEGDKLIVRVEAPSAVIDATDVLDHIAGLAHEASTFGKMPTPEPAKKPPLPMRAFDSFIAVVDQLTAGSSLVIAGKNGVGKTALAKRVIEHLAIVSDFPVIHLDNEPPEEDHPEAIMIHEWATRGEGFDGTEEISETAARIVKNADLVIGIDDDRKHAHMIKNRISDPFSFVL